MDAIIEKHFGQKKPKKWDNAYDRLTVSVDDIKKIMDTYVKQEVDNYKTKLLENIACEVKKTFVADQDYWGRGCNAACDEIELLINKE